MVLMGSSSIVCTCHKVHRLWGICSWCKAGSDDDGIIHGLPDQAALEEKALLAKERELETARLRAQQEKVADRQSAVDELRAKRRAAPAMQPPLFRLHCRGWASCRQGLSSNRFLTPTCCMHGTGRRYMCGGLTGAYMPKDSLHVSACMRQVAGGGGAGVARKAGC